jgi:hypothetical protein
MTPQEKAIELVDKMQKDFEYFAGKEVAKQHALIALYEMISEAGRMKSSYMGRKRYEYLLEVKQEIEKL